jgi:hypothetical protein
MIIVQDLKTNIGRYEIYTLQNKLFFTHWSFFDRIFFLTFF